LEVGVLEGFWGGHFGWFLRVAWEILVEERNLRKRGRGEEGFETCELGGCGEGYFIVFWKFDC